MSDTACANLRTFLLSVRSNAKASPRSVEPNQIGHIAFMARNVNGRIQTLPRFFLHQRHGGDLIEDIEGAEFADLDALRREAVLSAREIMSERLLKGEDMNNSAFEIVDEGGNVVLCVSFKEALPHRLGGDA